MAARILATTLLLGGCLGVPGFSGSERDQRPAPGADGGAGAEDPDGDGDGDVGGEGPALGTEGEGENVDPGGGEAPAEDCADGEVFDGFRCRVKFKSVKAGKLYSCGLTEAGSIRCWGGDGRDNSGDRDPRMLPPDGAYERLELADNHGCAMDARGVLTCWGEEYGGEMGDLLADTPATRFLDNAVGGDTTCAIPAGGFVKCWGNDYQGQGDIDGQGPFEYLTAGSQSFCGVRADATARCWGWQPWVGDERQVRFIVPNEKVCALALDDGALSCWNGRSPDKMVEDLPEGEFSKLALGRKWGCALVPDKTVHCFKIDRDPFEDPFPDDNHDFTEVAAGFDHACALYSTGVVLCWGGNANGQLDAP